MVKIYYICAKFLKASFRPKLIPTHNLSNINEPRGDVEVIRPRLSEAGLAKRRLAQMSNSSLPIPPVTQPCDVTITPTGRIITILGDQSDSDEE